MARRLRLIIIYQIIIYPNPSNGQFTITGNEIEKIKIVDITSKIIKSFQGLQNLESIDKLKVQTSQIIVVFYITALSG